MKTETNPKPKVPKIPAAPDSRAPALAAEAWPVDRPKPYAKNPRRNDAAVEKVAASIREFGWAQPIVVDGDGVIIIGHTRLKAAKKLGLKTVPVLVRADLSPEKVAALRLADNKTAELAEWDEPLLAAELDALVGAVDMEQFGFDLSAPTGTEGQTDEDAVPEPPPEPVSRRGAVYALGRHRLMCGDSTSAEDFARLMGGRVARMCVTSPPYGVGKAYEESGIEPWRNTIFPVIENVTKYCRIVVWNISDLFATGTQFIEPTSMYSTEKMRECGFLPMYFRIWKKQGGNFGGTNPYQTVSMKPIQEYEWILCYGKADYEKDYAPIIEWMSAQARIAKLDNAVLKQITGAGFMFGHWFTSHQFAMMDEKNYAKIKRHCAENGIDAFREEYAVVRRRFDDLNIYGKVLPKEEESEWGQWAVWEIPTVSRRTGGHPAEFPVELPARCIKIHSREGDLILEPFCGAGTTLIASEKLGRVCYGMELDPHYCDIIRKRWAEFVHGEGCDWQTLAPEVDA